MVHANYISKSDAYWWQKKFLQKHMYFYNTWACDKTDQLIKYVLVDGMVVKEYMFRIEYQSLSTSLPVKQLLKI